MSFISASFTLLLSAIFGLLSVGLGAFAAHALKLRLDEYGRDIWQTATIYQMFHALVLLGLAIVLQSTESSWIKFSVVSITAGICLFSGSLYILALTQIKWLGAITPLGGLGFLLGWGALIVAASKGVLR